MLQLGCKLWRACTPKGGLIHIAASIALSPPRRLALSRFIAAPWRLSLLSRQSADPNLGRSPWYRTHSREPRCRQEPTERSERKRWSSWCSSTVGAIQATQLLPSSMGRKIDRFSRRGYLVRDSFLRYFSNLRTDGLP